MSRSYASLFFILGSWQSMTARSLPLIPRTASTVSSERIAHTRWSRQRLSALVVSRPFRFVGELVQ